MTDSRYPRTSSAIPKVGLHVPMSVLATRVGFLTLPLSDFRSSQLTVSDFAFVVAIVSWAAGSTLGPRGRARLVVWIAASVLTAATLSIGAAYNAVDISSSVANSVKLVFAVAVAGTAVFLSAARAGDGRALVWCYAVGGSLATLSAVAGIGPSAVHVAGEVTRLAGLAGHPVGLAISAGTAIAMLAYTPARRRRTSAVKVALLLVNAWGIAIAVGLSGAFVAIAGLAIGLLYLPDLPAALMQLARLALVAGTALGIALWLGVGSDLYTKLLESMSGSASGISVSSSGEVSGSTWDIRFLTWEAGLARALDHPLAGNGLDEAGQLAVGNVATHNYVILGWQTGGIIVGMITIAMCVLAFTSLWWLWRERRTEVIAASAAAALVATMIGAMTSPGLFGRSLYALIGLGFGVAWAARERGLNVSGP